MRKFTSDLWIGLRTGPARAGLALLSLALGLFAVAILLATFDALQRQAADLVQAFGAGSFVLVHADSSPAAAWNRRQVEFFRENLGDAAWVSGVKMLDAPPGADFAVAAADADLARVRRWRWVEGRALDGLDLRDGARHAMAPAELCRRNGWRAGDILMLGSESFRLVGCFESGGAILPGIPDQAVFIPFSSAVLETGVEEDSRRVDAILFRAGEGTSPESIRRRVATLLKQPGLGAEGIHWITPETLLQGIRRWQRAIAWTAGSGGVLSLLLGAVTLAGMLLTGVRERIPEIGLRRALGARPREIAALFVIEALVLTGAAAVAGELAAEGALHWLGERFPLPFHFGAGTRLLPLALAGGLAILCSIGPAWKAARLPPAEALRNE
jgi:putative ABC transport system permease protein